MQRFNRLDNHLEVFEDKILLLSIDLALSMVESSRTDSDFPAFKRWVIGVGLDCSHALPKPPSLLCACFLFCPSVLLKTLPIILKTGIMSHQRHLNKLFHVIYFILIEKLA